MLAKSLHEGILLELPLAAFLLKKMRGGLCDVNDLPSLDPEVYRHLLALKHYSGACVTMCVCVYIHIRPCVCVLMCVCVCLHTYPPMCVCVLMCVCVCLHTYPPMCVCVCVLMCVCVCVAAARCTIETRHDTPLLTHCR
jgi:hypothetical protein